MELCEGGELLDYITDNKHLNEKMMANIMRQAFYALSYLHENRIYHADIKAENFCWSKKLASRLLR